MYVSQVITLYPLNLYLNKTERKTTKKETLSLKFIFCFSFLLKLTLTFILAKTMQNLSFHVTEEQLNREAIYGIFIKYIYKDSFKY